MDNTEQQQPPASPARDAIVRAVIAEGVSLAALGLLIWVMGSGGVRLRHLVWRARQHAGRGRRAEDAAVGELRADISRWEHGQRSPEQPPAKKTRGGGCGCGGAS